MTQGAVTLRVHAECNDPMIRRHPIGNDTFQPWTRRPYPERTNLWTTWEMGVNTLSQQIVKSKVGDLIFSNLRNGWTLVH